MEKEFEFSCPIASGSTNNTKGNGGRCADETRSRGDTYETSNGTRAEANNRPLALKAVILREVSVKENIRIL